MPHAVAVANAFRQEFSGSPEFMVRAPGRLDLIGAHVDYNEGPVLVAAISLDVLLAAAPARGGMTTVVADDLGETATFGAVDRQVGESGSGVSLPAWARYPAGVAWALAKAGLACPPLDVLISSDVPIGAGVSSSAALEVAFARAWGHAAGWSIDRMALAKLCRRAENEYVGVDCGLMDQFASVFGMRDRALLLDCRSLEWRFLPMPEDTALVLADTGTRRQLSDGRLNERHGECMSAMAMLRARRPGLASLRDLAGEDLLHAGMPDELQEPERSRARHIAGECARVWRSAEALQRGDAEEVGRLMNESHVSARDLYDVSGPELDAMWAAANEHPDCLGGRSVGAGFAGCQVFLVRAGAVDSFTRRTARLFTDSAGLVPQVHRVRAADGAEVTVLPRRRPDDHSPVDNR